MKLSSEERRRLKALQNGDARDLHHVDNDQEVTPEVCREWRDDLKESDMGAVDLDCHGFSRSAIRKHATGKCRHDPEVVGAAMEYNANFETWQRKNRDKRPVEKR